MGGGGAIQPHKPSIIKIKYLYPLCKIGGKKLFPRKHRHSASLDSQRNTLCFLFISFRLAGPSEIKIIDSHLFFLATPLEAQKVYES